MPVVLKNNAFGFLQSAISNSDTTAVLTTGTGANFPTLSSGEYFYATISPTTGASEIVKVTARSGDLLTIVRAQEGTSALSFSAGSRVELRVTARSVLDAIDDRVATKDHASEIAFTPVGGISATNVQTALAEVDSEKVAFTRLDDNDGANLVGFLQTGTGAVARTVQGKLRDFPSPADYATNTDYLNACLALKTNKHWAQNGAIIHRLSDRLLVGGAVDNDGVWPNINKDWLTSYQNTLQPEFPVGVPGTGVTTVGSPVVTFAAGGITPTVGARFHANGGGIPEGATVVSVDSPTQITLSVNATSDTTGNTFVSMSGATMVGYAVSSASTILTNDTRDSRVGLVVGAFADVGKGNAVIGLSSFAISSSSGFTGGIYGGYFEAHRYADNRQAVGIEIDVSNFVGPEYASRPFRQSSTVALQLAAGCGINAAEQYNPGAAIQIVGNHTKFHTGISFLSNSIVGCDGLTGYGTAISMAPGHRIQWFDSSGLEAAGIVAQQGLTSDNNVRMVFHSDGIYFYANHNVPQFVISKNASAANFIHVFPQVAGGAPYLQPHGTDADIDLRFIPKGTGVVRFGIWTSNADVPINGYITIKDHNGTIRKLATIA